MKLTVITATFNAVAEGNATSLRRCVASVARLKTEHEHLIYDGASKDGTIDILCELKMGTPGLKVVSEPDKGVYNALNKGVRSARGQWLYVLGCDDYISSPDTFDALLSQVAENVDVIVAPTIRDTPTCLYKKIDDLKILFKNFPYSHQSVIMRTDLAIEQGGFDERFRLCADWNMIMKCYSQERIFWYTENPIAFYAKGGLSEREGSAQDEQVLVYSNYWGLRGWRQRLFVATGAMPLYKVILLFGSRDSVVRAAARYAVRLWIVAMLRIVFWPVVSVRRRRYCRTLWN